MNKNANASLQVLPSGGTLHPYKIVDRAIEVIEKSGRLDIVINNAGVGITGPLEEIPSEEIKNNFETNLFGPIEVMKAVLPQMRTQKSGLIINITSIAGYMGLPYRSVYSASKGALELITEALRMETKSFGIHITNVAPGDFATNIAAGRYHAPVIKGSAYEIPYGNTLKEMNEHVDSGSNPNDMALAIYAINPEYISLLFVHPVGRMILTGALVGQLIGILLIRRIVAIEV